MRKNIFIYRRLQSINVSISRRAVYRTGCSSTHTLTFLKTVLNGVIEFGMLYISWFRTGVVHWRPHGFKVIHDLFSCRQLFRRGVSDNDFSVVRSWNKLFVFYKTQTTSLYHTDFSFVLSAVLFSPLSFLSLFSVPGPTSFSFLSLFLSPSSSLFTFPQQPPINLCFLSSSFPSIGPSSDINWLLQCCRGFSR